MKISSVLAVCVAACLAPSWAWARGEPPSEMEKAFGDPDEQEEEDIPPAFRDEPGADEVESPAFGDEAELPAIGQEDQLAVFELQRGIYFSTDLGMFLSFGGTEGLSDLQPYMAVHAGFDFDEIFSVQASIAGAFVANNPPSDSELQLGGQQVTSYQMLGLALELVASLRPVERLSLEPKVGGGIALISPSLTDPSNPNEVLSGQNPQITYGLDVSYLTLLTGFEVGAFVNGVYVFGPDIPGLGFGVHFRYTL